MKVYIHTWGCQMNVLDSEVLSGQFAADGCLPASSIDDADVIIFNTCSVRAHAENKVFSQIGRVAELKARRPGIKLIVAGCMAQRLAHELKKRYPAVDLVVGTRRIGDCLRLAKRLAPGAPGVHVEDDIESYPVRDVTARQNPSQAFVSVMRGCDNFCAYCIVPYVRGRRLSRPAAEILDEVRALVDDGVVEITLLGQNVTAYGRDSGSGESLAGLLQRLQALEPLRWIKFVTSHPRDTGDDIFAAMRDLPKVCRYLHLPAQSGSDRVLKAMRRGYTRDDYLRRMDRLREIAGPVSVASDFIVGFPGETEEDFLQTVDLVNRVEYKNSFIFKYSPREGTSAARLDDDVPIADKKRRNNALLDAQKTSSLAHNRSFVSRVVSVLVDGPSKKGPLRLAGRTEGEEIVIFDGPEALIGSFVDVKITRATPITLFGQWQGEE